MVFANGIEPLLKKKAPSKPHLFRFDERILNAVDLDDIEATSDDMEEMDLLIDPYDRYCIECTFDFANEFAKKSIKSKGGGFFTPEELETSRGMKVIFDYRKWKGVAIPEIYVDTGNGIINLGKISDMDLPKEAEKEGDELFVLFWTIAALMRAFLIVMLATKNTEKKTVENSAQDSKHRVREDSKKFSQTTTIRIGKITESFQSKGGTGGTKRPHLRRGHIRTQRFGKGYAEEKKIFIQPVFVNADDGWIAEQKTYRVTT